MNKYDRQLKIANLLFGLILVVSVLYYEPFVISQISLSDCDSRIDRVYSIESMDLQPEMVVDKSEQLVSHSIKCSIIRNKDLIKRILKKDSLVGRKILNTSKHFLPAFCISCSLIIDFEFGASILFQNTISYILSQIGL